jgi:DNA adenine methylase
VIQPLLKWTGCKRRLVPAIRALGPDRFEGYFEPFAGSGVVFFNVPANGASATLGDLSPDLMAVHEAVRDRPGWLLQGLYERLDTLREQGPGYYYAVRARFNRDRDPAALVFLTRTCYWGVTRFNRRGDFNMGFHAGRFPRLKGLAEHVHAQSRMLRRAALVAGDYAQTLEQAGAGDWVYLDPPYPGGSQVYLGRAFDYERFARVLGDLDRRGCRVLLSFAWDARRDGRVLASSKELARWFAAAMSGATLAVVQVGDYGVWHAGRPGTKVRECLIANYELDLDAARTAKARIEVGDG